MKKINSAAKNLASTLTSVYGASIKISQSVLTVNKTVTVEVKEVNGDIKAYVTNPNHSSSRPCRKNIDRVSEIVSKINYKAMDKFVLSKKSKAAQAVVATPEVEEAPEFDILERFSFMSKMTKMVINNVTPSLLITGEGGLGKTFTVMKEVTDAGLEDEIDYTVVKGFSTARGLFNTLYENSDKLVIFDDCDSILKDATAVNLLKAALDSYEKRIITWNAQSWDESRPNKFEFTGKIIFISNLTQNKVDQAVKSRALRVDLSMTLDEKIRRMDSILEHVLPEYNMDLKKDALDFLNENKEKASELNMRTLLQVSKIRATFPDDWKGVAMYTLTA